MENKIVFRCDTDEGIGINFSRGHFLIMQKLKKH